MSVFGTAWVCYRGMSLLARWGRLETNHCCDFAFNTVIPVIFEERELHFIGRFDEWWIKFFCKPRPQHRPLIWNLNGRKRKFVILAPKVPQRNNWAMRKCTWYYGLHLAGPLFESVTETLRHKEQNRQTASIALHTKNTPINAKITSTAIHFHRCVKPWGILEDFEPYRTYG